MSRAKHAFALLVCAAFAAAPSFGNKAATPSEAMKAVVLHEFGGSDQLRYEDAPKPEPAAGEVRIRVHAAGVNPVDWKIRDGMLKGRGIALPFILGFDVSGSIDALGEGVVDWKVGDDVCVYLSLMQGGGYAEYVCAPAKDLARKPRSIDHVHAAAVPLAALTAWQALFDKADLKAGQTVLIHAGAGGVGHFAVQFAKWKGATVITTASAKNKAFLESLGADRVVDYRSEKFEDVAKDIDVVFDMVGGDTAERSVGALKEGGFFVSIVGPPPMQALAAKKAKGTAFLVQPDGKELATILELIASGKVKPEVSATYPLADAAKAQDKSRSGVDRGKIVLTVVPGT